MHTYFTRHLQVLFATLGAMRRTPMASLNTILIVAITLLLPSLLYVAVKSGQEISGNWRGQPQISIFMRTDLAEQEARLIYEELRLHPAITLAEFISPQQALEEFRTLSGLDYEIDYLGQNPLPASIVVMLDNADADSDALLALKEELGGIDGIDSIRLDLDWTDRFNAILNTVTRAATLLSGLLVIALILIVSNTIKLLILNRRKEIEVTKLVGGSDTFVRRPFLYYGMLFGILGAMVSLMLLLGAGNFMQQALTQLAKLYPQQSLIYSLKVTEIGWIIFFGGFIGWLAARWSVAQHLWKIKPR